MSSSYLSVPWPRVSILKSVHIADLPAAAPLDEGILRNVCGTPSNPIGNVNRVLVTFEAIVLHQRKSKRAAVVAYVLRTFLPRHLFIDVLHANATS
jgi:hypothetical protein